LGQNNLHGFTCLAGLELVMAKVEMFGYGLFALLASEASLGV
jgi:hypothetical protein